MFTAIPSASPRIFNNEKNLSFKKTRTANLRWLRIIGKLFLIGFKMGNGYKKFYTMNDIISNRKVSSVDNALKSYLSGKKHLCCSLPRSAALGESLLVLTYTLWKLLSCDKAHSDMMAKELQSEKVIMLFVLIHQSNY